MPILIGDDPMDEKPSLMTEAVTDDEGEEGDLDKRDHELPGPAWQGLVFALVPLLVIFLGTGRETWSKGTAAILVALVMLIFPVRRRLPLLALLGLGGALLAPLLAFLPVNWQMSLPAWRTRLIQDWEVPLSSTITPQAWVTWEAWLLHGTCLAWLAWCLTRGFSSTQRRMMLQTLSLGGVILCGLVILEHLKWIEMPWWPRNQVVWGEGFGLFANRNHTSSIAAITILLCAAMSYDAHRRKSRQWMLCLAGSLLPLACIFINTSKAGVMLLFLGLTAWLGTSAMRKGFFQKMAVTTSLVMVIATLLVISGGGVGARLESGQFTNVGARLVLAVETLKMAVQAPWLGVGLGNFEAVFPQVTDFHEPRSRFLHPENDYLWLLAEGGLLTALPVLLLLLWLFQSSGPWFGKKRKSSQSRLDRRLRNAAAIAFGMGLVHGLVDVPNHGMGYAIFMGLLAGILVRPRRLKEDAGTGGRLVVRTAGAGVLLIGAGWLGVTLGHTSLFPGSSAAESLRSRANWLTSTGSLADGLPLMNEAVRLNPMNLHLYFERARMLRYLGRPNDDVLMDFSRSRALDPHYAALCFQEGVFWLDFAPQYAVIAWREYLRRYPASAPGQHGYYRVMLNHAERHPELREPLWSLATTVELKLDYLTGTRTREEFDHCLRSMLALQPQLENLESSQRRTIFEIWNRLGDQNALMSLLESNKKWLDDGWMLLAEHLARNSEFERACQIASPYLPSLNRPTLEVSADIATLERAMLFNPADPRRAIDLFQAQKKQGDIDAALRTLEKLKGNPNAPPYLHQEIAALYMKKQDFRRAWEHFREAMQKR
jgi:O-antigen ligase/tetratricopeptide (TPR) repeat protein